MPERYPGYSPLPGRNKRNRMLSAKKVLVLNGAREKEGYLDPVFAVLNEELRSSGAEVRIRMLRKTTFHHCMGCFRCWIETPGRCVSADAGYEIIGRIVQSDLIVLFSPVTFGGYSSVLKKIVDRYLPLLLPYFVMHHGNTHHPPRYPRMPRLAAVGVLSGNDCRNQELAIIFRQIVGRNALNFRVQSHAAEVVAATDSPDALRVRFHSLLSRADQLPANGAGDSVPRLMNASSACFSPARPGRALLIVGSPKTGQASTSSILGGYLLERIRHSGCETETLKLTARLTREKGRTELLASVNRADLVILAFPLYFDTLPFLMTLAIELISADQASTRNASRQRLFVLCNNGFPEPDQNRPALAVCRQFAAKKGMVWAGSFALGAGEFLINGRSFGERNWIVRSLLMRVKRGLNLAADALADGRTVPVASAMIAKRIWFMPPKALQWIYLNFGAFYWRRRAAENGIGKESMLARPYSQEKE